MSSLAKKPIDNSVVVDSSTGALYGHIVSGNTNSSFTYLVPSFQVFEDIRKTFDKLVELPIFGIDSSRLRHNKLDLISMEEFKVCRDHCTVPTPDDAIIAVIGAIGAGKSTFIANVTGQYGEIGYDLEPCTYRISHLPISALTTS